jgi:hypothetical protein
LGQIVTPSNAGFSPSELDRRKFQQTVAVTLDRQAAALSATREFMADLSVRLDEHAADLAIGKRDVIAVSQRFYELETRGFLGRLRWLFTGQ